ncbi:TVP38/TMEM64 family protein [Natronococcus occultus]|uniref:VTT domain-containing protein n=1 Tax=Natronococcus occultus SP4 TaxID=694430 RepID=L0K563_9EURY|nr:VTT domain-containing protein [Natronococcus occultus]AGB39509.1 hypothetical protein Natoc_3802 [Natronococcus occultus SP4]
MRTDRTLVAVAVLSVLGVGALVPSSAIVAAVEPATTDPVRFGILVAGLYLLRPLATLPTTPLAVVVGYGYGVAIGIPIALAGVAVTVVPVFLVARRFVRTEDAGTSPGRVGRVLGRARDTVERYYETAGPIRGVVAARLAPIPSDVATCGAAISGVSLRQLVAGTVVGELPWTVAAVVVGASTATVAADGVGELGLSLALACTGAAALLLAGPISRRLLFYSRPAGSAD